MITIHYCTSWNPVSIHGQINGEWCTVEMQKPRKHWAVLTLNDLQEFVFTDNSGEWDNPPSGGNYSISGPGKYAVYKGIVIRIEDAERPLLLISDLDNTLVGNHPGTREALSRFTIYWLKHHYFSGSRLVYSTGRSLEEYLTLYEEKYHLLDPDMVVTAVGSDAYTMHPISGEYILHEDYYKLYNSEHWDSNVADMVVQEHFPWFQIPKSRHIFPFKIWGKALTVDVEANIDEMKKFLMNEERQERHGIVLIAKTIISGEGDWKYIDITPPQGGKKMGLIYSQSTFGFDDSRTVVAGDSGNDIDMFRGDHHGVIVANHQMELEKWFKKKPRTNKYISTLFWADAVIEALENLK